ncbi:Glycine reductase complex selenoprotein A [Enterococcus malodoratus]|nr:Glycine reductase complex selenoprotein A [Enterococcus malodoratus]
MTLDFKNKKVLVIGDRDGIPGQAIEACIEGTDSEVIFSSTECFV